MRKCAACKGNGYHNGRVFQGKGCFKCNGTGKVEDGPQHGNGELPTLRSGNGSDLVIRHITCDCNHIQCSVCSRNR